jgi:SulP family sulfate permease
MDLKKSNIDVLFVDLLIQPRYMMERVDVIPGLIPEEHIFKSFQECTQWIKANVKDTIPAS